jgi:translocation protein SEC63
MSLAVIDERIVTPASIVYLVVKLRLKRPTDSTTVPEEKEEDADVVKRRVRENEAKDYAFLTSKGDAEEIDTVTGWAHAPYWPTVRPSQRFSHLFIEVNFTSYLFLHQYRRPGWWIVLADDKSGRVVVPPIKISDIPYTTGAHRDYRSYKLQFQAPQGVGVYTWKLYIVSDTFVGEEVAQNIVVRNRPGHLSVAVC